MEKEKITDKNVPYIVFESTICRFDRVIKRLWVIILILVFLLLGTNLAWLYHEQQFEQATETTVEQRADDESDNSFIGGDNNVGVSEDSN